MIVRWGSTVFTLQYIQQIAKVLQQARNSGKPQLIYYQEEGHAEAGKIIRFICGNNFGFPLFLQSAVQTRLLCVYDHISLKKGRVECCTRPLTAQNVFWPLPSLISYAGVTWGWRLFYICGFRLGLSILDLHHDVSQEHIRTGGLSKSVLLQ